MTTITTLCACARGKVICRVIELLLVSTKIAIVILLYWDVGIWAQWINQIWQKMASICFKAMDTIHKSHKISVFLLAIVAMPIESACSMHYHAGHDFSAHVQNWLVYYALVKIVNGMLVISWPDSPTFISVATVCNVCAAYICALQSSSWWQS